MNKFGKIKKLSVSDINTGDLALVYRPPSLNPSTWLSAAIRFFTKSKLNHTDVFLRLNGNLYVMGAIGRGIFPIPYERWEKMHDRYFTVRKVGRNISESEVMSHSGKKYDLFSLLFTQPIYILSTWFLQLFNKDIEGFWVGRKGSDSEKLLYCSEFGGVVRNFKDSYKLHTGDIDFITKKEDDGIFYQTKKS